LNRRITPFVSFQEDDSAVLLHWEDLEGYCTTDLAKNLYQALQQTLPKCALIELYLQILFKWPAASGRLMRKMLLFTIQGINHFAPLRHKPLDSHLLRAFIFANAL